MDKEICKCTLAILKKKPITTRTVCQHLGRKSWVCALPAPGCQRTSNLPNLLSLTFSVKEMAIPDPTVQEGNCNHLVRRTVTGFVKKIPNSKLYFTYGDLTACCIASTSKLLYRIQIDDSKSEQFRPLWVLF